jgi:hypothetical protein
VQSTGKNPKSLSIVKFHKKAETFFKSGVDTRHSLCDLSFSRLRLQKQAQRKQTKRKTTGEELK